LRSTSIGYTFRPFRIIASITDFPVDSEIFRSDDKPPISTPIILSLKISKTFPTVKMIGPSRLAFDQKGQKQMKERVTLHGP
jgi:hypothetical protein